MGGCQLLNQEMDLKLSTLHFSSTVIVMSHRLVPGLRPLRSADRTVCTHTDTGSTEIHLQCKDRTSVTFIRLHYQSAGEVKITLSVPVCY